MEIKGVNNQDVSVISATPGSFETAYNVKAYFLYVKLEFINMCFQFLHFYFFIEAAFLSIFDQFLPSFSMLNIFSLKGTNDCEVDSGAG